MTRLFNFVAYTTLGGSYAYVSFLFRRDSLKDKEYICGSRKAYIQTIGRGIVWPLYVVRDMYISKF